MAEKKEIVAAEAAAKEPAKKASAKTATTAKASTAKAAADKAPAKKTTAKSATDTAKKAPAKKAAADKTVAAATAEVAATEVVTDKAPAKKSTKKSAAKAPLYIHGRYIVEKQLPQKPQKGAKPYAAATSKVKVTLVKSTVGCLDDQIATVEALGLTKIRTSNVLPDNAATRGMIFKVKHLVVVEEVK